MTEDDNDEFGGVMPEPIDVREGIDNQHQRALVEAALFDEPATPVRIGRFTIVRQLGAGGMGVVYMAYDEQLDRRVAVKLLKEGIGEGREAQLRLQREAQAMARLPHPNVVAVHEVGTYEGQVFVAMEFVAGRDLRGWLRHEARDRRQVLSAFVQAGEGLAAAHQAGLVHRDFKPDNVLMGDDGRVRVADFGLAYGLGTGAPSPEVDVEQLDSSELAAPLTKTGAILGTPAYMAPEQFRGERADAKTDQFSFCVALYEALHGERPFEGRSLAALLVATEAGQIRKAPADSEVPPWLRAAIVRGLSAKPEDRWPSMQALLDALTDDPVARRRRVLRALLLVIAVVGGLATLGVVASRGIEAGARQRFWAAFNEHLLQISQEFSIDSQTDAATRARDSARLITADRFHSGLETPTPQDPTIAAALLRDVEGADAWGDPTWIRRASITLGEPISYDVLTDHHDLVTSLLFGPGEPVLYSASKDGTVRRLTVGGRESSQIVAKHDAGVFALALDPTGRWLAWGSNDHRVGLWPTDGSGKPRMLVGHDGPVRSVAFAPDGRRLVSASEDHTARVWRVDGGDSVVLRGHTQAVTAAVFGPDGERVLTASKDDQARLWAADDGRPMGTLSGHRKDVFHARFAGRDRIVTGSDDGTVRLWRRDGDRSWSGSPIVDHGGAQITSLDVHGERWLSTDSGGQARVWGLGEDEEVILRGHTDAVWVGMFSPDGEHVVTAGFDHDVRIFATSGQGGSEVLPGHRFRVMSAAIDHGGRWLATGSFDGTIRLWDLRRPRARWVLSGHRAQVWSAAVDPTGERVVTISYDGTARVWSTVDGELLRILDPGQTDDPMTAVAHAQHGRTVATGSGRGRIVLWDLETGEGQPLEKHARDVWSLAFDSTAERLASASRDGTVRVWDVGRRELVHELRASSDEAEPAGVSGVIWSRDDARLYTSDYGGMLRVWDPRTGEQHAARSAHGDAIVDLVLGPDGRTLATSSRDWTAKLWPDPERAEPVSLVGHGNAVWAVAFSPEGDRVVTASHDKTARVWSTDDGRLLATLSGHTAKLWDACFCGDGTRVFTASNDGTVRAWAPGELPGAIAQWNHDSQVVSLWTVPSGDRLISTSADRTARIWRIDDLPVDAALLRDRLHEATRYCVPAEVRMQQLGEDRFEAESAVQRCRARR